MIELKAGDKAPYFSVSDQNGNIVTLDSLKGKKIILYFYPKDNTSGCTAEACSLRDGEKELKKMGYEIIGVSPDSETSHQKFIAKQELPFMLLADKDNTMATAYGTWGEKKLYGRAYMGMLRTTFILDENGIITHVIEKVRTKDHFEQLLEIIKK